MGMERPEIPLKGESWVAPCGRALGRYAPVTHCADGYEQKYGHWWFYAAVGCSDMLADLGEKRLVARNRCHAAHLLSLPPSQLLLLRASLGTCRRLRLLLPPPVRSRTPRRHARTRLGGSFGGGLSSCCRRR